jgi:serine/threonine protein kinase
MTDMKTVMLIDDDFENSMILSEALELYGYDCIVFQNPVDALDQCSWLPPDAIIVDFEMPQMTGVEFCKGIHERLELETPPVILLSGVSDKERIELAFEVGVTDYVLKPAAAGLLSVKLKQAMLGRKSRSFPMVHCVPKKLGQYTILEELGRGGMGVVYKAICPDREGAVAVKTLLSQSDNLMSLLRFRREIDLLVSLSHPNLIKIYDTGRVKDVFYYSMELIDGPALSQLIDTNGSMTPADVTAILQCMAHALDVVHKQGLIHRDVKTANILICPRRGGILCDFGLSKSDKDKQLTKSNHIVGTPHFMSPELIQGKPIDNRSDLFSLGMVALEMIAGGTIFDTDNTYKIMHRISEGQFPSAHTVAEQLDYPSELLDVIDKLLKINPDERFPTALDLSETLYGLEE